MLIILLKPSVYVASALNGVKLWALVVLPALLPFFFFTALLSKISVTEKLAKILEKPCKKLFKTSGFAAYVFLMSVLSGYPVGAKIIGDLGENGLIDSDDATRTSTFCSTSGPLFIVGSVGVGMFGSASVGKTLLLTHVLSALVTGLIFRFFGKSSCVETARKPLLKEPPESDNVLYDCVYSSVVSIATVGGFICVFYVVADILQNLDALYPLWKAISLITKNEEISKAFAYGLIECTRGCKTLALCGLSTYSLTFASALISFGGVSVLVQSVAFLKKANVKISVFLLAKIVQTSLSFVLLFIF